MSAPTPELRHALRRAAARLEAGAGFRWSHFGSCICGHLVQDLTGVDARLIQAAAFEGRGDWGAQAREYCPTSGLPIDAMLGAMIEAGLRPADIEQLERLSDPRVLARLPGGPRPLSHLVREDAVAYMRALADELDARAGAESRGRALDTAAA
jgi:hypothetical protein